MRIHHRHVKHLSRPCLVNQFFQKFRETEKGQFKKKKTVNVLQNWCLGKILEIKSFPNHHQTCLQYSIAEIIVFKK